MHLLFWLIAFALAFGADINASAADDEVSVTITDHKFDPAELNLPAGKKVVIKVTNKDSTPEEFESGDLDIEKIVAGNETVTIRVGPLDEGSYEFVGEYHADTAKGVINVR